MGPGLYVIVCSKTGKIYFGESENLLYRLGMHYKELVKGKHECKQLQEDWNSHGLANISFVSLSVGPEWDNTTTRRNAETKLIQQNFNIVYNLSIAGSVPKQNSDIYKKRLATKVLVTLVSRQLVVELVYQKPTSVVYSVTLKIMIGCM